MHRHLMLGLKGSGKTTFLAALWHLLEAAETTTRLRLSRLQADREYLNDIRNSWLSFEEVGRTTLRVPQHVSVSLEDMTTRDGIELSVPDLSGETYSIQWSARRTSRAFADLARVCTGLFVFIHAGAVRRSRVIAPDPTDLREGMVGSPTNSLTTDWYAELAPTQVQLVDVIQFVDYLRANGCPLPVAVVISAWDLIHGFRPEAWLARRMPLLSQFLISRADICPYEAYGVSAQGGDLVEDRKALLGVDVPAHRIRVIEGSHEEHRDLTAPVKFLLSAGARA
jgi:hypothetical protein